MIKNSAMIAGVLLLSIAVLFGIYASINASYQCGWAKTMLYGKSVTWAYYGGYCD